MGTDHSLAPRGSAAYALRPDRPRDGNLENLIANWNDYRDRLIVFLGAGASVGARGGPTDDADLPTALWLRNDLWQRFMVADKDKASFAPVTLGMLSLEHVSALIESRAGRRPLVEYVSRKYGTRRPLWSHLVLPLLRPKAVFTTNYDQLIEQGWDACRRERHVDAPLVPIFAGGQRHDPASVPLFKPHGSAERAMDAVGRGGLVITLFDYFQMLSEKQALLHEWLDHFQATCAIFVGYSFMDMDIASYLYKLRKDTRDLHWYAAFPRGDDDVRRMYERQFGIQQINRTLHELLVDLDAAVDFIPAALKPDQIPALQGFAIQ